MIIRERTDDFVMIKQHDHAHLSGQIADNWKKENFLGDSAYDDVVLAIYEHDRSWISADDVPFWDDREQAPYSFMNFPLLPKLVFYEYGLDHVEKMNPYAGLLCSLHYASFFENVTEPQAVADYRRLERKRQERLRRQCGIGDETSERMLQFHFRLLQFCDNLSLYVCLNEPGIGKAGEHPWYRNGFAGSDQFAFARGRPVMAHWVDGERIAVDPFPFAREFTADIRTKQVGKERIRSAGIAAAYEQTPWCVQKVTFVEPRS